MKMDVIYDGDEVGMLGAQMRFFEELTHHGVRGVFPVVDKAAWRQCGSGRVPGKAQWPRKGSRPRRMSSTSTGDDAFVRFATRASTVRAGFLYAVVGAEAILRASLAKKLVMAAIFRFDSPASIVSSKSQACKLCSVML